jgi:SAM-dependent methyltransferase
MVRLVNSTVQIIAFFNNFLVISAFFGLGLGSCLVANKRNLFHLFPGLLVIYVATMAFLDSFGFTSAPYDQVVFSFSAHEKSLPAPLVVLVVFAVNIGLFIPIGYRLGATLEQIPNRLTAYSFDLLGSLLGVIGFGLISFFRTPPWVWLTLASIIVLSLLIQAKTPLSKLVPSLLLLVLTIMLTFIPAAGTWSPYYKITALPYDYTKNGQTVRLGYAVLVDKNRIQDALDFDKIENTPLATWLSYYEVPYQLTLPKTVLIMAGGSGNDAVAALRAAPQARIDVVDVDPVLLANGYTFHPQKPYRDPRVHVFNDDARAYLKNTDKTYDLIVMNALDSHHQAANLSTLKLESFIYTVECFRDIKRRLTPNGGFLLNVTTHRVWIPGRVFWSLTEAFGQEPRMFLLNAGPFNSVAYYLGPKAPLAVSLPVAHQPLHEINPHLVIPPRDQVELITDDWPQLYLERREIPELYLMVLGLVLVLALGAHWLLLRGAAFSGHNNLHFFLLGAGFMLLETRSLTKSALLFGSTWFVNAIVIAAILLMIFCANALVLRFGHWSRKINYAGLAACLLIGYLVPLNFILDFSFVPRVIVAGLWLGSAIFFAGLIFSSSFRKAERASSAFGANLLGVVLGGCLEYTSMCYGLNFLYLLALAIYLLAYLTDQNIFPRPTASGSNGITQKQPAQI